jgi:hypothetical protein
MQSKKTRSEKRNALQSSKGHQASSMANTGSNNRKNTIEKNINNLMIKGRGGEQAKNSFHYKRNQGNGRTLAVHLPCH